MGKALYRKYRPKCLSEVVGENQVTESLGTALKAGKISHAYLFIGPRGCGKTSVARIFAHEINNFPYELEDDYVDIIEIDGASNRGIDNIRELREKVAIAPTKGKYKVYIIDEVHMLTKEAFNALLKTLEEPPAHTIFIMATTDAHKVPITITSRSQIFTFNLADPETMFNHLKSICEKEGIKIDDDATKLIVKRGGGSFRDSLSLLDQISTISEKQITKASIIDMFGVPEDELIDQLLASYVESKIENISSILKELFTKNIKAETIVEELVSKILEDPRAEFIPLLSKLTNIRDPFANAKLLVALSENTKPQAVVQKSTTSQPIVSKPIESKPLERPKPIFKAPTVAPAPTPIPTARQTTIVEAGPFTWEIFLNRIKEENDGAYSQITKTTHEVVDDTLHIYPEKKIQKTILEREGNKNTLIKAANGLRVKIHDVGEAKTQENPLVSKISDIMGGAEEVKKDGGEVPF